MFRKAYPSDLTDTEWKFIEPLLPAESTIGHPRKVDFREIVNAIFMFKEKDVLGEDCQEIFRRGKRSITIYVTGDG